MPPAGQKYSKSQLFKSCSHWGALKVGDDTKRFETLKDDWLNLGLLVFNNIYFATEIHEELDILMHIIFVQSQYLKTIL